MYNKLKKQNGEKFAQTIRNFHNGILEIPNLDVILRHAGRDAEPLLPYLASLLASNDDTPVASETDPFVLLGQAGYNAFHADTLEKQNSIRRYFAKGELLCTFNDRARYQDYHIVHAVKKNADLLRREDFKGKEDRQDPYGTSVISIQMLKDGGFISIKNRYNHSVPACDNTYNSNPDNIIEGLSGALKNHFNVDFSSGTADLPESFVLMGKQVFEYYRESNNIYYGEQAWASNGVVHLVDKSSGDVLFVQYLFDNRKKILKYIDPEIEVPFVRDFNRYYGGNNALTCQNGKLMLNGKFLLAAEKAQLIRGFSLFISDQSLERAKSFIRNRGFSNSSF